MYFALKNFARTVCHKARRYANLVFLSQDFNFLEIVQWTIVSWFPTNNFEKADKVSRFSSKNYTNWLN